MGNNCRSASKKPNVLSSTVSLEDPARKFEPSCRDIPIDDRSKAGEIISDVVSRVLLSLNGVNMESSILGVRSDPEVIRPLSSFSLMEVKVADDDRFTMEFKLPNMKYCVRINIKDAGKYRDGRPHSNCRWIDDGVEMRQFTTNVTLFNEIRRSIYYRFRGINC